MANKLAPEDFSDGELDEISDEDDHISHRVPDSGVKIFHQFDGKSQVTEEAEPGFSSFRNHA